jgi:hypothetical protein
MRSEWVPLSAAALVTGVMALVLGQVLDPGGGSGTSPAEKIIVAADSPARCLAMSILYFGGAAALVLGMPAVMTLFQERRGRGVGMTGIVVFTVGCVGVAGVAAVTLVLRALALQVMHGEHAGVDELGLVTAALADPGLVVSLRVWAYGFLLGVLLIAIGLLRGKRVPGWIPLLLMAFLAVELAQPLLGEGTWARVTSSIGLILLAGGFTGMATNAASPRSPVPVTHTFVRS